MLKTGLTFHKESHCRIAECAAYGGICLDLGEAVLNGLNLKVIKKINCNGLPVISPMACQTLDDPLYIVAYVRRHPPTSPAIGRQSTNAH